MEPGGVMSGTKVHEFLSEVLLVDFLAGGIGTAMEATMAESSSRNWDMVY